MCTGEGIMFKNDRRSKIARLKGFLYICNKDPGLVATATSLSYLSFGNTNSHSKINEEAPFDSKILRG